MKSIIVFTLFLGMFTACMPPLVESQVIEPVEVQPIKAALQTQVPILPADTLTPTPIVAIPQLLGQVSIEHAQVIYYDITGSTARELRLAMDEVGPRDASDNNKSVDASVDWYIAWNWPGYGTEDCDLSAASVTYSIKVIMPRWDAPAEADPALISKWEEYIHALASHEKEHVNIILAHYPNVKTAIQSATCSTADAAAQTALEPLQDANRRYDRETGHGAREGAVFP